MLSLFLREGDPMLPNLLLNTLPNFSLQIWQCAVFPMGSWLAFPLCGLPLTGVPAPMYGAVASVLLQTPYFKHLFAFMGCRPAGIQGPPSAAALYHTPWHQHYKMLSALCCNLVQS